MSRELPASFQRNRIIRNYLAAFSPKQWEQVTKYTLIFGIQALEAQFDTRRLSTQHLEQLILRNAAVHGVEENLPKLRDQIEHLQAELADLQVNILSENANIHPNVHPHDSVHRHDAAVLPRKSANQSQRAKQLYQQSLEQAAERTQMRHPVIKRRKKRGPRQEISRHAARTQASTRTSRVRKTSNRNGHNNGTVYLKPSSRWRSTMTKDDVEVVDMQHELPKVTVVPHDDHFDFHHDDADVDADPSVTVAFASTGTGTRAARHGKKRSQPRMAYSAPPAPAPHDYSNPRPFEDDVVTTRYISVPSSGYGQSSRKPGHGNGKSLSAKLSLEERKKITAKHHKRDTETLHSMSSSKSAEQTPSTNNTSGLKEPSRARDRAFAYGDRITLHSRKEATTDTLPPRRIPRHLKTVRSRIRDRIAADRKYYQRTHRDKDEAVREMLTEDPVHKFEVLFKPPVPTKDSETKAAALATNPAAAAATAAVSGFARTKKRGRKAGKLHTTSARDPALKIADSFLSGPFASMYADERLSGTGPAARAHAYTSVHDAKHANADPNDSSSSPSSSRASSDSSSSSSSSDPSSLDIDVQVRRFGAPSDYNVGRPPTGKIINSKSQVDHVRRTNTTVRSKWVGDFGNLNADGDTAPNHPDFETPADLADDVMQMGGGWPTTAADWWTPNQNIQMNHVAQLQGMTENSHIEPEQHDPAAVFANGGRPNDDLYASYDVRGTVTIDDGSSLSDDEDYQQEDHIAAKGSLSLSHFV
jgi:hypothetical protein